MKKLNILFTNESALIKYGLQSGFRNLGHNTILMENENRLWDKPKDIQDIIFENFLSENPNIDLCISECFADFSEGIFKITKENNIKHFFWSIEDTPFEHWIGDYWSTYADHVFTTTAECLMNYWEKNLKADLVPFGVNRDFHKPGTFKEELYSDIVFVGNNYQRRERKTIDYYFPLIRNGYDFKIYGNSWWMDESRECNLLWTPQTYQGLASYENLNDIYRSTKIILGAQCDDASYTQMSMRNFEALGWAGDSAIMISPYSPAQEFLFGEHILLPKNSEEMRYMIDMVLNMSEDERLSKAKEAQEYVYRYHNYDIRAKKILENFKYGSETHD